MIHDRANTTALNGARSQPLAHHRLSDSVFTALITTVFFSLVGLGLVHHAMWRDEMQAWLIARDSATLPDLLHNMRYEGHPVLWQLGLFLLTRVTHNPVAMQIYHLVLATTSVFIFVRYAPFPRLYKALFVFGYFPFYEYALISRSYVLGILLTFCLCALFPHYRRKYKLITICLLLLANTSIYGVMLAVAFCSALCLQYIRQRSDRTLPPVSQRALKISSLIFFVGLGATLLQIRPAHDVLPPMPMWTSAPISGLIEEAGAAIVNSYLPIPQFTEHVWNTNILSSTPLGALIGFGLLAYTVILLRREPIALCLYLAGTLLILLFIHFVYQSFLRHLGHLFILWIAALWIAHSPSENENTSVVWPRETLQILGVILVCQLVGGIFAFITDLAHPFSNARAASQFIRAHHLDKNLIVGDRDFAASPIAGYLDCQLYYPASHRFGSFVLWNHDRQIVSEADVLTQANALAFKQHRDVLLVLDYPLKTMGAGLSEEARFTDSIVGDETYWLYRLKVGTKP